MAQYKVPQDVEAEDKLLGPFSFRQFIYLMVAAIGIFLMWALAQIFIGLLIIPFPVVAFFLILALPLRKDQPMEAYLLAMVQFFLKPRKRYWNPDGTVNLVEITAPKVAEKQLTKDFSGDEASQRLAYLAQVIDTGGWAARGAMSANDSMNDIVVAEASHAEDVLDDDSGVGQSFDQLIASSDNSRKQAVMDRIKQSMSQTSAPSATIPTPSLGNITAPAYPIAPADEPAQPAVKFDPYPAAIHQKVIDPNGPRRQPVQSLPRTQPQPVQQPTQTTTPTPSESQPSPDIIRLANNNDLSISAIAREAHRKDKHDDEEVVISLR